MCLAETLRDLLVRRIFIAIGILASGKRRYILEDLLVDCRYTSTYTVINEAIVPKICEKLKIEPLPLSTPKPLRGYDGKLSKKPITYFILLALIVNGYYESIYPILIAPLQHNIILGKPWMNKYGVLLDILRDKLLFIPGRYIYNGNTVSSDYDLQFVLLPTPVAILLRIRPPTEVTVNHSRLPKSDSGTSSSSSSSKSRLRRKRTTPAPR